jgi:hypothetical protein
MGNAPNGGPECLKPMSKKDEFFAPQEDTTQARFFHGRDGIDMRVNLFYINAGSKGGVCAAKAQ